MTLGCKVRDRFWGRVDRSGECWTWTALTNRDGYGRFWFQGRGQLAHRVAHVLTIGEIPKGMEVDHLCRNRACVRPSHLEVVTRRENQLRGFGPPGIRARSTHCVHGHPFDDENTRRYKGWRYCRACQRERDRARRGAKV
jgi:hypothetical protein